MTDPVERVGEWLETQGYPLEFEVARMLQAQGFTAAQGVHYSDSDAGEQRTREIDVVAGRTDPWPRPDVAIDLVVEVKHSHEPWLVLTTEDEFLTSSAVAMHMLYTEKAEPLLQSIAMNPPVPQLLTMPPRFGFNVIQTHAKDSARPNPAGGRDSQGPRHQADRVLAGWVAR